MPFAVLATTIIRYTGYTKIFIFALFVFGLRFIGYSVADNIAWVLPLECLEGWLLHPLLIPVQACFPPHINKYTFIDIAFTSSLPMTAAAIYASTFSTDLLATLQGVNAALHFGIGQYEDECMTSEVPIHKNDNIGSCRKRCWKFDGWLDD